MLRTAVPALRFARGMGRFGARVVKYAPAILYSLSAMRLF